MKICLVFLTIVYLFTLFSSSAALSKRCTSSYDSRVAVRCPRTCCNASCRLRHSMGGAWFTKLDETASLASCSQECGNHFSECRSKCSNAVSVNTVESSSTCKCTRTTFELFVRLNCFSACSAARNNCISECIARRCPLEARTAVRWSRVYPGNCSHICSSGRCSV